MAGDVGGGTCDGGDASNRRDGKQEQDLDLVRLARGRLAEHDVGEDRAAKVVNDTGHCDSSG